MESKLKKNYKSDQTEMDKITSNWSDREDMYLSKLRRTGTTKSKIAEGALTTLIVERSARVVAQLPGGVVKAKGKKNKGKAMLVDLVLKKYLIPNANSQYPLLQKFRMQDELSMVYGTMFGVVDWVVKDGYVGPDYFLVPARSVTPQTNRISIEDCDYFNVDRYYSPELLEKEVKKGKKSAWNVKNLKEVLKRPMPGAKPDRQISQMERERSDKSQSTTKIRTVVTYKVNETVTWDPEADLVLKIDKNKIKEIPVAEKFDMPLLDSIWGLSTMERGESIQKAKDSLINLFHEGAKHFVFPPTIVNPNGVVPNTLRWGSGKFWLERIPNSIRRLDNNPAGLGVFQGILQALNGMQQNLLGTTTTEVNAADSGNPSFGKTPEALKQLNARESTRDNQDRVYMEQTVEKVYNLLIKSFIANSAKATKIDMLADEIDEIAISFPEIADFVTSEDGQNITVTVSPSDLQGAEYMFEIDSRTTKRKEEAEEFSALTDTLLMFSKIPELEAKLAEGGWKFDMGELVRMIVASSGAGSPDKIIFPMTDQEAQQAEQKAQEQKLQEQQALQQQQMAQQVPQQIPQPIQQPQGIPQLQDPATQAVAQQIAQQAFGAQGGQATAQDYTNF